MRTPSWHSSGGGDCFCEDLSLMATSSSPRIGLSEVEVSHPWSEEETYLPRMLPFFFSALRNFFFTMGLVRTEGADLYLFLMFFTSSFGFSCSLVSLCGAFSRLLRLASRYCRLDDWAARNAPLDLNSWGISLISSISVSTSGHIVNLLFSAAA